MRVEKKSSGKQEKALESIEPIETDYEAHSDNPAPSKEAVVEENDQGGGKAIKWIIPLLIAALVIVWLLMR